jgi:cyclopropane fatty-acyl-phospholipid synthase-like methyltransferase
MALSAVKSWFGRHASSQAEAPELTRKVEPVLALGVAPPLIQPGPPPTWTPDRLVTTDALWGEGYQFPGGEIETLRLAKPLGLSKASSLLLIGAGAGGPACSLAVQLGVWVSGFEADSNLVAAAVDRIARRNLTRRAQTEVWNPAEPHFREHFYHHGLLLEALHGSKPEPTLAAIAKALKPSGHLMMLEVVADKPLDPANPIVAAWAHLERRDPRALPTETAITRILGRLGFDVRVAEDVSDRHIHQALMGWRSTVRTMEDTRPTRRQAMRCVQEAELWMLRLRLLRTGKLRLMRWHAIGGG